MRFRRRGIAILSSLFVMVLVIMFVTAAVSLLPQTVDAASNSREGREAMAAAQAGVDYAWCRLQERPGWKGDGAGNGAAWTINTANLKVYEDHGNVWGFVTGSDGNKSQFRIRFNYQDGGTDSSDGLSDPATTYLIKTPYISFNNLSQTTAAGVRRAQTGGNFPYSGSVTPAYNVAPYSVALLVEGRAGDGLRDTNSASPNPGSGNRRVVSHISEVHLTRPMLANLDSAIYGSSITAAPGASQVLDIRSSTAQAPRARSLNGFTVSNPGKLEMAANGRIIYGNSATPPTYSVNSTTPTNVYEAASVQHGKFLKLKSTDMPKANPAADATLPAGTYIWRVDGSIDYYAQDYSPGVIPPHASAAKTFLSSTDLTAHIAGAGQIGTGTGDPIIMDPTTYTLEYTRDVYVAPQGAVKGLAIVPEGAVTAYPTPDRPKNLFKGASSTTPVLSGTGDITLSGANIGKGSVSSSGNITFQGASIFETDPAKSVAIYAKNNVTMEPIPPDVATNLNPASNSPSHHALHHRNHHSFLRLGHTTTNSFTLASIPEAIGALDGNDVMVAGLIYAGGNFTTNLGSGTMYLRGALVAYGGDADLDQPPGTLGGQVNLISKGAQVNFDPNYIANALQMNAPGPLTLALRNSY